MGLTGVVVGIDGGGSKTDAVAATPAGEIVARRRIGTTSPHLIGVDASAKLVVDLVTEVCGEAPPLAVAVYLSGLDLPSEVSTYRAALQRFGWPGLLLVDNDVFALLRAGTQQPDAVAVVCGTGINAVGRRADGATVRFPALGSISGDWGGGHGLGQEALWYAARAEDGRGEPTALVAVVCAEFGVSSIVELTEQLHVGRRDHGEISLLSPAVFVAAAAGDPVATALGDRLAAEMHDGVAPLHGLADRIEIRQLKRKVLLVRRAVFARLAVGKAHDPAQLRAGLAQRRADAAGSARQENSLEMGHGFAFSWTGLPRHKARPVRS